jgi:hypothetical protein
MPCSQRCRTPLFGGPEERAKRFGLSHGCSTPCYIRAISPCGRPVLLTFLNLVSQVRILLGSPGRCPPLGGAAWVGRRRRCRNQRLRSAQRLKVTLVASLRCGNRSCVRHGRPVDRWPSSARHESWRPVGGQFVGRDANRAEGRGDREYRYGLAGGTQGPGWAFDHRLTAPPTTRAGTRAVRTAARRGAFRTGATAGSARQIPNNRTPKTASTSIARWAMQKAGRHFRE